MNFNYYETHAFHKLKNNLKLNKSENFSIFHSNICSLQENFDKLEILLDNLEHQFDVIALTETWHMEKNINFTPGILPGYQKYEGLAGLTKKGGCGVYIKDIIPYIMSKHLSLTTFFIDFNNLHCTSGNFFEKISDHLPDFLIIEKLVPP